MSSGEDTQWDRMAGEGPEAFAAAAAYFALGPERSIDAVGRELGKSSSLLSRWSARFDWVRRAAAYDSHMESIRRAAREAALARQAAKWERRRFAALEMSYDDAQALRRKARAMLELPVAEPAVGPDGVATLKATGRWSLTTAAQMLRVAAELEAASCEAATGPLEELSDAELKAIEEVGPELAMAEGA